jgi:hypothetical protein
MHHSRHDNLCVDPTAWQDRGSAAWMGHLPADLAERNPHLIIRSTLRQRVAGLIAGTSKQVGGRATSAVQPVPHLALAPPVRAGTGHLPLHPGRPRTSPEAA